MIEFQAGDRVIRRYPNGRVVRATVVSCDTRGFYPKTWLVVRLADGTKEEWLDIRCELVGRG